MVFVAVLIDPLQSFDAQLRFQRARLVIDARVDDARVVARLVFSCTKESESRFARVSFVCAPRTSSFSTSRHLKCEKVDCRVRATATPTMPPPTTRQSTFCIYNENRQLRSVDLSCPPRLVASDSEYLRTPKTRQLHATTKETARRRKGKRRDAQLQFVEVVLLALDSLQRCGHVFVARVLRHDVHEHAVVRQMMRAFVPFAA